MTKILLTRPQKISEKIANNLTKKNLSFLIQPLFSIIKINDFNLPTKDPQAILISSFNAVFALEKLDVNQNILILAIGENTATAIKELGYSNVIFADNSSVSLLRLAQQKLDKSNGLIIYLSGQIITLDLEKELLNMDFETQRIVVYKTKEIEKFSEQTIVEITNNNISEIWIYSQNSAKIFYKLIKKYNLFEYLKQIKILSFSQHIANFTREIGFLKTGVIKNEFLKK